MFFLPSSAAADDDVVGGDVDEDDVDGDDEGFWNSVAFERQEHKKVYQRL